AAVLDERAVERRAAYVGVGADEPRRQDTVAGVHPLVGRALVGPADVHDAVALEHHLPVAQDAVLPPVERDDPARPNRESARHAQRPWPNRKVEERPGSAGALRAAGGLGAMSGPP